MKLFFLVMAMMVAVPAYSAQFTEGSKVGDQ